MKLASGLRYFQDPPILDYAKNTSKKNSYNSEDESYNSDESSNNLNTFENWGGKMNSTKTNITSPKELSVKNIRIKILEKPLRII